MKRLINLFFFTWIAWGLLLADGCRGKAPPPPPESFSILLITIDTLRADHLSCYGYERETSPAIDGLAEDGILFERTFCPIPLTIPSHASILSGCYPRSHGSRNNSNPVNESVRTLAEVLKDRGFKTAAVLSTALLESRLSGLDRGFDLYCDLRGPVESGALDRLDSRTAWHSEEPPLERRVPITGRRAEAAVDIALEVLRSFRDQKLFLWLHFYDPHTPYDPPGRFNTRFSPDPSLNGMTAYSHWQKDYSAAQVERIISLYDGEIAYTDTALDRLFSSMRQSGDWARTLVILTSDHGESLDEHGYYFSHGRDLYGGSVLVPLIVRVPWMAERGYRVERPVDLTDIFPLVQDLAGGGMAPGVQGRSLLPDLENRQLMKGKDIYMENEGERGEARHGRGSLSLEESKAVGLVWERWKLIKNPDGRLELYDWYDDPGETRDLAGSYPRLTRVLMEKIAVFETLPLRPPGRSGYTGEKTESLLRDLGYIK
jgi:arylsulfatase A-like enzyme